MTRIWCLLICLSFWLTAFNQKLYYADVFYGGVTGAGFALPYDWNGSGSIAVNIPPTSTIRKALLISGRNGSAPVLTINFAGNILIFDSTNQTDVNFQSLYGGNSSVHIIDVTLFINPAINSYSINVSTMQQPGFNRYNEFYLYVLYEDNSFSIVNTYLFLNDKNFGVANYTVSNLAPINNLNDVGLSLLCGYIGDTLFDNEVIYLNSNFIGLIGGNDINSGFAGGPYGDFYYENNQLFGLSDDTANTQMSGSDVLLNMSSFTSFNATNFILNCIPQTTSPMNKSNNIWSFFLTYSNNCDTFTTTATANTDTVCAGESVQLNASGGAIYSWFSAFSTFNDSTLANPLATPTQTTTYIVTITNDSGCVKTEQVKVWVRPAPQPDTVIITPQNCGNQDGVITIGNITNGAAPFTIVLTNLTTLNIEPQTSNLLSGIYQLTITDANGCVWQSDTLVVPVVNNTQANFITYPQPSWSNPTKPVGKAPLPVDFINQSTLATNYEWFIISSATQDTIYTTNLTNFTYEFAVGGTFELCLIAYNNIPICADTLCKIISIDENLSIIISNLLTPNGDGKNDTWYIANVSQLNGCSVMIFNRWGAKLFETANYNNDWEGTYNGKNLPDGSYFYVIVCEDQTYNGPLTLLR